MLTMHNAPLSPAQQALAAGGLTAKPSSTVLCTINPSLNADALAAALNDLAEHRTIATVFKTVLSPDVCAAAVANLQDHHRKETYEGAKQVGRIGKSLYETQFGTEHAQAYWQNAEADRAIVRAVFSPYAAPMDVLQVMCDGLPGFHGARLLRIAGNPAFVGLLRYLDNGGEILPHTDVAPWDVPGSLECQQVDCQIAANFYLNMPEIGGEVTIYDQRVSKLEYDANRRPAPDRYALTDAFLTGDSVTIKPEVGDLVLFNANLPHRVSATSGETRYTSSSFIGVCRDRSLVFFS